MATKISPRAIVHAKAELGANVEVHDGAFIDEKVVIGDNTIVHSYAYITGRTTLGKNNVIYPYAVLGTPPQDITYKGEDTGLIIGDCNVFREFVTVNRGTLKGDGYTRIGSNNLIMACSHIAHDCVLGNMIVMANSVLLGGHVLVEDNVVISGLTGVHHFVSIGKYAFISGCSGVTRDVPPFMLAQGNFAKVRAINVVGLKRNGFSNERIMIIKDAFKYLYKSGLLQQAAIEALQKKYPDSQDIKDIINFINETRLGRKGRARERLRKWN